MTNPGPPNSALDSPDQGSTFRLKDHAFAGVVFFCWGLLVVAAWVFSQRTGIAVPLCTLRRVTGLPCPTCGGTRATMSLVQGHLLDAMTLNPGVTILLLLTPLWIAWRWPRAGKRTQPWTPRRRAVMAVIAWVVLASNWAYVLWHEARLAERSAAAMTSPEPAAESPGR